MPGEPFVLRKEPRQLRIVHQARRIGMAGTQFLFLQATVATHGLEILDLEHHQHIQLVEQAGVILLQPVIDHAPPDEVRILFRFQRIDGLGEGGCVLRFRTHAPAFEQQHIHRAADPFTLRSTVILRLVEAGEVERVPGQHGLDYIHAQCGGMGTGNAARGKQRVHLARQPLAFCPRQVEIVDGQRHGAQAARLQEKFQEQA